MARTSRRRRPRLLLRLTLALGLALLLCCVWLGASILAAERLQPTHPADVLLVMGAGTWAGELTGSYRARLDHALRLYHARLAPRLLVTGETPAAPAARRYLLAQGVPSHAILVADRSRTTWEDLRDGRDLLRAHHLATAIVVSSPYHLYRCLLMAADLGLPAQGAAAPDTPEQARPLRHARFVLREALNVALYTLLGSLRYRDSAL